MAGWVYIISNKAMPGILKIGYTERTPYIRAYELYNTGCPYPYKVDYSVYVNKPFEVEQKAHELQRSTNVGKEWFSCSQGQAIETISNAIKICEASIENKEPPRPTKQEVENVLSNTDLSKTEVGKIINNLDKEIAKNEAIIKLANKIAKEEEKMAPIESLTGRIFYFIILFFIFGPICSLPITYIAFIFAKLFFNYNIFILDDTGWMYYLWGIPIGFIMNTIYRLYDSMSISRMKKKLKELKNQ